MKYNHNAVARLCTNFDDSDWRAGILQGIRFRFQIVNIVNLGSNDMLRGLDPGLAHENLNQILDKLEARGITSLLVGHLGPLNYGAEYKAQYDRAFHELATRYDVAFYPFYFKTLMAPDGVTLDLQNYFQADGLHPNAEGVAAVVAGMGPYVLRALGR